MLEAIGAARTSVVLEIYILQDSEIGAVFRHALVAAAARGVRVRVLVDAVGSLELPADYLNPVNEAGGDCRWFNPLELGRLSYRDHRKLLIVDDAVAFVPGFNIAREYDGDGVEQGWRDLGLVIRGPLVAELLRAFHGMFGAASFRHRRLSRFRRHMRPQRVDTPQGDLFLLSPGRGRNPARLALMADLARARKIRLTTAYFLPPVALRRALIAAARRGAEVELLLPGPTDVRVAQLAARGQYTRLLKAGVRIFEYQPAVLHAKRYLLDNVVYGGSANLDLRSLNINYEILVRLEDVELAREGHAAFEEDLRRAKEVALASWRKRSWWSRVMERLASIILVRLDLRFAMRQLYRLRVKEGRRAFQRKRRSAPAAR
ncbi:MAG: cardiolipin synthase B [Verrucomicrobiales bacterium]|nr:cardiolipin synthase B [Verrucomicrobiales bacterium]